MTDKWHGSVGLKINAPWFTGPQYANFHASVKASGNHSGPAHHRTHGRISLDGTEVIYEGLWTPEELTRDFWVERLASDTGKSEAAINAQLDFEIIGEGLSIDEGNEIVSQYLTGNPDKWEQEQEI